MTDTTTQQQQQQRQQQQRRRRHSTVAGCCSTSCHHLWKTRKTLIVVLTPLLLLPLPVAVQTKAAGCGYVILLMAVYWCTEALPMAITALLPIALLPWLDVMSGKQVAQNYIKDATMLFFGGLLIAMSVEKWGLHSRIALRILVLVGSRPVWVTFGFMLVTGFLSMWLSNAAVTSMMVPIVTAVLQELDEHRKTRSQRQPLNNQSSPPAFADEVGSCSAIVRSDADLESASDEQLADEDRKFQQFSCALKLAVAYASTIGGTGTLIGCGPNIVLKGQMDSFYGPDHDLDFTSWFIVALPNMLLNLFITWLTLVLMFIGPRQAFGRRNRNTKKPQTSVNTAIRNEYNKLGSITYAETSVLICFLLLVLLWLTKRPGFIPGWASLLPRHSDGSYVTDATLSICACILLFVLPSRPPNSFRCCTSCNNPDDETGKRKRTPALLDWSTVNKKMPWNIVLLLGGGFALADACQSSGLSAWIGEFLVDFKSLPPFVVVSVLIFAATVITTFTSNVSTTTILVPITAELAHSLHISPLYLLIPVTIASTFCYILPVSTPSNAIVFATGGIRLVDMIKAGVVNCVLHALSIQLVINTCGSAYFSLHSFPDWAHESLLGQRTAAAAAVEHVAGNLTTTASLLFGNASA